MSGGSENRPGGGFGAADLAMLGVITLWAVTNVMAKRSLAEIAPFAFIMARFTLAAPVLMALVFLRQGATVPHRRDWGTFLLAGAAGFSLYNIFYTLGIDQTSAFSASLIQSTAPLFTLLLARALGIERVTPAQWLGVGIAMTGVVIFMSDKMIERAEAHPFGDLLTLAAAALFAVYGILNQRLSVTYGSGVTTAWCLAIGGVLLLPVCLGPALRQDWSALSPAAWAGVLMAAFGSMVIAYSLWAWAVHRGGVGRTIPYFFLWPILTGVISAAVAGERFGPVKVIGAGLVMAGTAAVRIIGGRLAARDARRQAAATVENGADPAR
ncbi:MAG: DMT family transporter [Chloroflexota bacterium]